MHKITPLPKRVAYYWNGTKRSEKDIFSMTCELKGVVEGNVSPCSHFNYCERPAVIWLYDKDGAPYCYGLCNECYAFSYPCKSHWYRVVRVLPEFNGVL